MTEPAIEPTTGPTTGPTGHLFGVGVGPGDPELLTFKARRVIGACDVVAHFAARDRPEQRARRSSSR